MEVSLQIGKKRMPAFPAPSGYRVANSLRADPARYLRHGTFLLQIRALGKIADRRAGAEAGNLSEGGFVAWVTGQAIERIKGGGPSKITRHDEGVSPP
jgi:hypothetical protein